ncbi:MAG: hypothetical protein MUE93_06360 [Ignavibacteriaceae bacterium]|jgi:hypothetical protein|nr:hypothetical protein [Ignavibacteriaceae bacterium]
MIFPKGQDSTGIHIHPAENYPRWLKNDVYHTNQTSGMTFLREKDDGTFEFLLADDIGKIHRLFIQDDTLFSFSEIKFSYEVLLYLADFPKLDFEEIFYDSFTGEVYLTIEGNGEEHLSYHGIYKLNFKDDNVFQDSVVKLTRLEFTPQEIFYDNLLPNIGYEGFTADENYFYLGLENEQTSEGSFSGQTIIRIADKKSLKIVKVISTENIDISTVCGLYSDENFSLWGIDRNHRKVFKLLFDEYFNIVDLTFSDVKTIVPKYNQFEYVGSLESITLVSEKFLFLVDDPWHKFFIPPNEILNKLDENTVNNFKNFVPVIHKFNID